jgi:hypothetical protein
MGLIEGWQRPRLGPKPGVVALGPRLLRGGKPAAMAEEELREAMPRAEQISADVFTTSEEVPGGFFLLGRNVNRRERARSIQHREVRGIPAVGFDAIARTSRDECGRDDVAGDRAGLECSSKLEPARPRFVTTGHQSLPAQPVDEAQNGRAVRCERM